MIPNSLKLATPRWVKEVAKLVSASQAAHASGDIATAKRLYSDASNMARLAGSDKARTIRSLGAGLDVAAANLMGGKLPGNAVKTGPIDDLFVAKLMGPSNGLESGRSFQDMMRDRAQVNAVIPKEHSARNYGVYTPQGSNGAVELQQFLPYPAEAEQRAQLTEAVLRKVTPKVHTSESGRRTEQRLWDVNEHEGNIRLDADLNPKILDARYGENKPISMVYSGSFKKRKREAIREGAAALHNVDNATPIAAPRSVPPPAATPSLTPLKNFINQHPGKLLVAGVGTLAGASMLSDYNRRRETIPKHASYNHGCRTCLTQLGIKLAAPEDKKMGG